MPAQVTGISTSATLGCFRKSIGFAGFAALRRGISVLFCRAARLT
jgi:hypothetical protein